MKLPRDLTGQELASSLRVLGYSVTRQSGSHLRLTTELNGQHHEVIPNHAPIKVGTLQSILNSIAAHHGMTRESLLRKLQF
jgi:predicted RNA binding protein YcfA (HicA-like mRNA interferase family)